MGKIKTMVGDFFRHWNTPAEGKFVGNKEVLAYSVGGMGVHFIQAMVGQVVLSANCILIGSVYGIKPTDLAILSFIATFFMLITQPLKSYLIDNTNTKKGKARPYIFWLGPPTVVLTILVAFIPMSWTYMSKVIAIGIVFTLMNFINQFYLGMYGQLVQLMTPNTNERANIISISSIVYSFAPTITGFVLPMVAGFFPGGLLNITVYRIMFPIFSILGLGIGYLSYFGTKERIVVPKRYKAKVKFMDGMKKIIRNKYFWILNISSWVAFARNAATVFMGWLNIYVLDNYVIMAFVSLVIGTASLVGMVIGPFLIKVMGKKWTVIVTNAIIAISSVLLIFVCNNYTLSFIVFYLLFGASAVQIITAPAMNADALDYQQWRTGDRLEGFVGNFGIIGSLIGMGTGFIIPFFQESFGLIDNYDILYDPEIRVPIFRVLAIIGVVGTILHTLPYFFYDLTEKKHRSIIEDLKERAIEINKEDGIIETEEELEAELAGISLDSIHNKNEIGAETFAAPYPEVFDKLGESIAEETEKEIEKELDEEEKNDEK